MKSKLFPISRLLLLLAAMLACVPNFGQTSQVVASQMTQTAQAATLTAQAVTPSATNFQPASPTLTPTHSAIPTGTPVVQTATPTETPTSAIRIEPVPIEEKVDDSLVGVESSETIVACDSVGWYGGKPSYDFVYNDVVVNLRMDGILYVREGENICDITDTACINVGANGVTAENNLFYVKGQKATTEVCINSEGVHYR